MIFFFFFFFFWGKDSVLPLHSFRNWTQLQTETTRFRPTRLKSKTKGKPRKHRVIILIYMYDWVWVYWELGGAQPLNPRSVFIGNARSNRYPYTILSQPDQLPGPHPGNKKYTVRQRKELTKILPSGWIPWLQASQICFQILLHTIRKGNSEQQRTDSL